MPHRVAGLLVHGHDILAMAKVDPPREAPAPCEKALEFLGAAMEHHMEIGQLAHGPGDARDHCRRPPVAAHGINGNDDATRPRFLL